MIQQLHHRIGKETNVDFAEKRIRNLFNIDILQNVQVRRSQFIQQIHPNPKSLIQEGYVVHSLPLRNCDIMKIYNYPNPLSTPNDQAPQLTQVKIQRIKTTAKKDRQLKISTDIYSNTVAKMPAFYTKHQFNSKTQKSMLSTESIAIRIRSLSRVKENLQDSQISQQRSTTPNGKKRLSQYKLILQKQINSLLQDSFLN
ncbi:unnamed protein product (macronuclear) [Paramecium tetraurelia]|uniref:Uncharacterized protein n=1 Tax=Paramecium tetraurelia TaxID=5888 RepID=A0EC04_PARTE|nr:uncharacterized protein GSPATT00025557001 [Paramecium tetraurelia]CAK92821.1 unnamed protein product [Paramecium tetraurelia]|eukprot:XP_001460218.1 hypothetical protein (macronuclear) [Paramecium tetraurelia strain d4-2]